jgi:hypothetical protein
MEGVKEITIRQDPEKLKWYGTVQNMVLFNWLVVEPWGKESDMSRARNSQRETHEVNGRTIEVDRKFLPLDSYKPDKICGVK